MKKYRDYFNQYVKNFDMKEPNIRLKFHHTYRVMERTKEICESIKLNKEDSKICEIIALFHDIGRFEQWTKYHTYWDKNSVDHAELSYEVIKDKDILDDLDEETKNIIYKAIRYHNKYNLEDIKDERELLFCKIIRDADKLDILIELETPIYKEEKTLKKELLKSLYNKESCKDTDIETDVDYVLRGMGFLFDLNYSYSYKYLLEKDWIKNKFNLIRTYVEDIDTVNKLEDFINKYVEEKIEC